MAKQTHCIVPILVLFLKIILVNADIRRSDYCSSTPLQTDYTGTINVTVSGKTCQMWNSQSPHKHFNYQWSNETNYCRNKDNSGGAWCLTTDPDVRWERCNVPSCENATYCTLKQKQLCGGNNYCGCKYLCHCGVEASCNPSDGTCFTGNCSPGWMGKSCQFVNIAFNQSTSLRDDKLVDGNRSTCSRRIRNVSLHLNERYPLSALVIVLADGIISALRISVSVHTNGYPNVINSVCSSREVSIADGQIHIFCTHVLRGDQLTIEFNKELTICEIEVYGGRNVALWQSTGQYGNYTEGIYTYPASLAVDGKTSTTLTSGTCTHTKPVVGNEQPWWQITLDSMTTVTRAKLYIRKDYHENRMLGFNISVNNDNKVIYQQHKNLSSGVIDIVEPFPLTIHSLKVTIPTGSDRFISLCEVQIFACLPRRNGTENCKDFCPLKCSENDNCVNQNFECNRCQNGWSEPFCSQESLQNDKQDKSSVRIYKGTLIAMGVIITLLIAVCTTLCILLIRHRSTGKEKGGQKDTTYTDLQLSQNGNSEESNYTQLELHH